MARSLVCGKLYPEMEDCVGTKHGARFFRGFTAPFGKTNRGYILFPRAISSVLVQYVLQKRARKRVWEAGRPTIIGRVVVSFVVSVATSTRITYCIYVIPQYLQ